MDARQDKRIKGSSGMQRVQAIAGEGLCYDDVLDAVSLLVAASPDEASLQTARNQLLVQVGLAEIAAGWQCAASCARDVKNHHIKHVD